MPSRLLAQAMGGMSSTTYRWALPLYLTGSSWNTSLHVKNMSSSSEGVTLLFRDASGKMIKRLHSVIPAASVQDLDLAPLISNATDSPGPLVGSVIVVQDNSMGAPALSGSAELTQSSLGSRTISIVELLSRIEDIPMSAWVGAYTDSGSGNITVITSTKQVQQTIIGDCSLRGGGVQQLRVPLEPHHTAILMDCELQTEGKWPAMRGGPRASGSTLVRLIESDAMGFSVFGLQLGSGVPVPFTLSSGR